MSVLPTLSLITVFGTVPALISGDLSDSAGHRARSLELPFYPWKGEWRLLPKLPEAANQAQV